MLLVKGWKKRVLDGMKVIQLAEYVEAGEEGGRWGGALDKRAFSWLLLICRSASAQAGLVMRKTFLGYAISRWQSFLPACLLLNLPLHPSNKSP